jgi:hypothetical protein
VSVGVLWALATFADIKRTDAIPTRNIDFMQILPNDDGNLGCDAD